jgi:ATP-dependent RNA helicase DeaD
MGISETIVKKLTENGVVIPTPIQEQAIPFVMNGEDIIAQAQTGTGKTFAFILPILEKVDLTATHVQALIVTPTRELALQITDEVEKLIKDNDEINALAVYGGQDVEKQLRKLKKNVQIVVGTPGRLLDHIRRETIDLSSLSTLVLDEADQMLHIGFIDEVEVIIKATPATRQTLLFSATIPPEIQKLARKHMRHPKYIQVEKTQGPAESVKQIAIHTIDRAKQATLIDLIETHRPFLAVIFCRTKRRVSKLYEALRAHGFKCDELHGDLSQAKREQVMKRFRDAEVQLLIATDVAARGLDVEGVTHVYNYDIPQDSESYIHRIGRTGRAGMTGLAVTLYASKDRDALDLIENELNIRINKQNIGNMKISENESNNDRMDQPITRKQNKERNTNRSGNRDRNKDRKKVATHGRKKEERSPFKNKPEETTPRKKRFEETSTSGKKKTNRSFEGTSPSGAQKREEKFERGKTKRRFGKPTDQRAKNNGHGEKAQSNSRTFEDRQQISKGQSKKNEYRESFDKNQTRRTKPKTSTVKPGSGKKGIKTGSGKRRTSR